MSQSNSWSLARFTIESAENYQLHQGFLKSHPFQDKDLLVSKLSSTFHACSNIHPGMLNLHLLSPNGYSFNAIKFLSMLQDRTIAFVGDSLGLISFLDLKYELMDLEDKDAKNTFEGNGLNLTSKGANHHSHLPAAYQVYFPKYNSTLLWCRQNKITLKEDDEVFQFCVNDAYRRTIDEGIIVYSVGAWYKPGFFEKMSGFDYYSGIEDAADNFEEKMKIGLKFLNERYSSSTRQIIWTLNAQKPAFDEYSDEFKNSNKLTHLHTNWDYHERLASWVYVFNKKIRKIVEFNENIYLWNVFDVSKRLIYFVTDRFSEGFGNSNNTNNNSTNTNNNNENTNTNNLKVHKDSIHYCSGTVFRQSLILLQDLVELHLNRTTQKSKI